MSPEEETLINRNTMKLQDHLYKALKQRDQYKAQRDTLIDDLAVLKANISRLERENGQLSELNKQLTFEIRNYEYDVKFLSRREDTLFDEWRDENKRSVVLSKELEKVSNLYNTLTNHIRLKAENNPGVSRYIDLVNYIDKLERD